MKRLTLALLLTAMVFAGATGMVSQTLAQALTDAQHAFQKAKAAYDSGGFGEARDLAQKGSETDPQNPDIFLLLGKAHYQLGELDEAMAAWNQTLVLAPKESFAKKMLEVLQARRKDVDSRIRYLESLVAERLDAVAAVECRTLLENSKPLSDAQRAAILTLQAELAVRGGQPADARTIISKVLTLYPKQADPIKTKLILGQAKLHGGGEATAEGLAMLTQLAAQGDTPAAATAQWELIAFDLNQGVDPARTAALAKWLADHPQHFRADEARGQLLNAYLTPSAQAAPPRPDSPLSNTDLAALAVADEIIKQSPRNEEKSAVALRMSQHFATQYAARKANVAAADGLRRLLTSPLPRASRVTIRMSIFGQLKAIVIERLQNEAKSGRLATADPATLPKELAETLAALDAVRQEDPTSASWMIAAQLAGEVRAFSAALPWPDRVTALRAPDAWMMAIALPILKADADPESVKTAASLMQTLVQEYQSLALARPETWGLALDLDRQFLGVLSPKSVPWPDMLTARDALLDAYAKYQYKQNIETGLGENNAKLSETQNELIDALAKLVAHDATRANFAVQRLAEHLRPWIEQDHWPVAQTAFAALQKALPSASRWEAELAVERLSVERIFHRDQRILRAGLSVPRELDPLLKQALVRLYSMQAGLEPNSSKLQQVRALWDAIIGHYRRLEYDDIAEAALKTKPLQAVEAADQYAEVQAIRFQEDRARRDLARRLKQYEGSEKIALTPDLKDVLAAWTKWIGAHSTSPLVPQAVGQALGIGRMFEQYGAFEVAAGVYGDFAKFAAGVKPLSQSASSQPSMAETASAMAATALDSRAAKALAKIMADRKPDEPLPAKLSDEFTAAIAAHKAFLAAYSNSIFSSDALRKITAVAVEYANIDAWEVAEGVYADLAKSELKIRRPERLEFARGLCQLGRAMPAHAREILTVLNTAGLGEESSESTPTALATMTPAGPLGATGPLGGRGGGGGGIPGAGTLTLGGQSWNYNGNTTISNGALALDADKSIRNYDRDGKDKAPSSEPAKADADAKKPAEPLPQTDQARHDSQLLAMIQQQESGRSARIAQMSENMRYTVANQPPAQGIQQQHVPVAVAPLAAAELARLEKAIDAAYKIFHEVGTKYADTPTAQQARGEVLVTIGYWRGLTEWERSATLAVRFLADNPRDPQLPQLRLEVARDRLAWAAKPIGKSLTRQELLAEVTARFAAARTELNKIVADFAKQRILQQEAQWDLANSFLTESRAISAVSPTLARGQFVRAARELRAVAVKYPGHPRISQIAPMLWGIAQEMENQGYEDESVLVWNELAISDPMNPLAQQAIGKIAQTYYRDLKRPLKAAETYLELNFIRGGSDAATQEAVFQIGASLRNEKRWVEALHVLETFVDSFPRHVKTGQALAMIGQIHQTNQVWEDAIKAYRRVIDETKEGQWVQEAKWSIAECKINLSQWREAMGAYRDFVAAFPQDPKVAEANRRLDILKDLARFQELINEKGQRKAFDAQFQIATIVRMQLANPVKGIIEYRKVVTNWPESYVAATALHEIGTSYLALGETAKAREAFMAVAKDYSTSPLAGASLFQVGKSYEDEADKLATVTRERTVELAKEQAQRKAYEQVQLNRNKQESARSERVLNLKKSGQGKLADLEEANGAFSQQSYNMANTAVVAQQAQADVETLSAAQLADRQDKINAALRKAIDAYAAAAKIPGGNKADAALLQMANIYDQRLKDSKAAMETWLEIVRQFSGTAVAQDASWKLAQYYEREGKYAQAIEAYNAFLRNYRGSVNAGAAQFAVAECYEHLGQWVAAMDSYNNYINNFPDGPLVAKAKEQIGWIKTYRL